VSIGCVEGEGCEWTIVTEPAIEPLTLAQAKAQCRVEVTDENDLFSSYIMAARQAAEERLGRGLLTQTWKLVLPTFAEVIWLPMAAPLASVTTVKYYDGSGVLTTLASTYYTVNTTSRPGSICRAPAQSWPSVQSDRLSGAVEITYVVGWTAAALVPERILQGCRLYVAAQHAERSGMTQDAELGRKAAEACWNDMVYWKPPAYAEAFYA
jgi:uncharacterized phiE125 gp8 family phage protein